MKTRIGHLLVRADLVTEAQLARALEVQNFAGGRIGTLLLERAALGEDDLGKTLALQHGCGYISWSTLSDLPAETLAVIPPRFALKHNAVPYELGEGYVRMALRDPNDLRALDELVFVTGRKVFVAVAPEVRIFQALEKYYGRLRAPRYAILAERLLRLQKPPAPGSSGAPPPPGFFAETAPLPAVTGPPPAPRTPAAPTPIRESPASSAGKSLLSPPATWSSYLAPMPESERPGEPEGIPWEDTTGSRSRPQPENPSLPPAPFEVAEASESAVLETARAEPPDESFPPLPGQGIDRVLAATEKDAIAGAVLEALLSHFPGAAIFSSRSDGVTGWAAEGKGVDSAALRSFSVSWTEPSVFLNARLSRSFYLGPLASLPRHDQLAAALGGWPGECLVQPVFLGEKPVAFLYAAPPSSGSFSASDLAYVRRLCDATSAAIANAIRLKKGEI